MPYYNGVFELKKTIAPLLAALLVILVVSVVSFADYGDFGANNDFGGGYDDGGGYDYGGYDYGGKSDDGYSKSRSRSSRDSDDDDGDYGSSEEVGWLPTVIVVGLLVALIVWGTHDGKSKNRVRKGGGKSSKRGYVNVGDRSTPQSALRPMTEYRSVDPDFDSAALTEMISNLYVRMQNAWTDGDISALRPYFTDALFTQFERQLAQKTAQGLVNHIDRISVQNVTLRGFRQESGADHIIVKVETRIVDYTVEKATGKIVSGSNTAERFMTYEWDMSRTTGFTTLKKDGVGRISCPNCGAPLDINVSARCEYCGGVITSGDHDWAIAKITAISQKTL